MIEGLIILTHDVAKRLKASEKSKIVLSFRAEKNQSAG
jgi:hypothetical protein